MRRLLAITLICLMWLLQPAAAQTPGSIVKSRQPIEVCGIWIKPQFYARVVVTETEICLENPNSDLLEGDLRFPLRENQTVTGFTLSPAVEGSPALRAVPVPKTKGTQVFEAIERATADPALMERAEGNIYSLRVYPLVPKVKRVVTIETTEPIVADAKGINHFDPAATFADIRGAKGTVLSVEGETAGIPAGALRFDPSYKRTGFVRSSPQSTKFAGYLPLDKARTGSGLRIDWTAPGGATVVGSWFERKYYFYADVPVSGATVARPTPGAVALIWDASGSGATRDHAREFALLDAYFRKLGRIEVTLVVARDQAEAPRQFAVANGDWAELRKALDAVPYDGATNPAAWMVPEGFGGDNAVALLFSDGLANWGAVAPRFPVTLFALNAAAQADANRLRHLAEFANGQYLDLTVLSDGQALAELTTIRPRLASLSGDGVDELVSASIHPEGGRLVLAGRVTEPKATVTVDTVDGAGKHSQRRISVPMSEDESDGFAAKRWAGLRIASLQRDGNRNRAEILRLGEVFGVISDETSLLALERMEDFLRYDVMPPWSEMRAEFIARRRPNALDPQADKAQVEDLVRRFNELASWWGTDFPKGEKPKPKPEREGDLAVRATAGSAPRPAMAMASPGTPSSTAKPAEIEIHLRKWVPDAPYLRSLKDAPADQRYAIYLAVRPGYANSTAFFIDAADLFFEAGQADLAVRILSNLSELGWSNRSLLRILAYRLQQAGQADLALPVLTRVRDLAPNEPQSWRDLGLANAAAGNVQQAIDFLWHVASHRWDGRFADIDLIALGELNALVARAKTGDLSRVDARLLRNLPVDIRTVLSWDADNTDMDLWVVDPNGETAFYGNRLTYQGGHMSRDFTGGLGPEEFMLKQAKPGRYEVKANFYGHRQQVLSPYTTVMLKFSTRFGTDQQKDEDIVLRLSGRGETVLVGSFEVKEPAPSE
jgi:Ca-activated chloride channel family protein